MFPAAFDYLQAHSADEALAALAQHGGDARVLAGGQSLIPAMRFRLAQPAILLDINPIAELAYMREGDGFLEIGACERDAALEVSPIIASRYHLIADASKLVADPVVRQSGTVVGSLCHNDPAGDWPTVALASRAQLTIRNSKGSRTVAADDFFVDSFSTAVADGEMAFSVRFPTPSGRTSGSYQKIERKVGDFATASAAVQLTIADDGTIRDAGIAIGAVGPKATRVAAAEALLNGQKPTRDLIRAAAEEAKKIADPSPDQRGSAEYKREMAGVLVARGLVASLGRLGVKVEA